MLYAFCLLFEDIYTLYFSVFCNTLPPEKNTTGVEQYCVNVAKMVPTLGKKRVNH